MENKNSEIVSAFKGKALNYVVIVKEIENSNVTEYGFDKSNLVDKSEKHKRGIIVSIGPSCDKRVKMTISEILRKLMSFDFDFKKAKSIKVGDEVLYDGYKVSPLSLDGIEYKTLMWGDMVMCF